MTFCSHIFSKRLVTKITLDLHVPIPDKVLKTNKDFKCLNKINYEILLEKDVKKQSTFDLHKTKNSIA